MKRKNPTRIAKSKKTDEKVDEDKEIGIEMKMKLAGFLEEHTRSEKQNFLDAM